jgi:CubicO group peptidase (beta-lactamase class C family)
VLPKVWSLSILLISMGIVQMAAAQSLPRAESASVGMSAEPLARFDGLADQAVESGKVAGVVTLVLRHGKVVHNGVYGVADIDSERPMNADDIFRIASMTKPITSVAIMILEEEGCLLLEDPVARYLPAFENVPGVIGADGELQPLARSISLLDLLSHTSGMTYGDGEDAVAAAYREAGFDSELNHRDQSISEIANQLAALPLAAQPGERFIYSYGVDVLGAVVEQVSGMSLDAFLEQRIFQPLGMHDSHFYLPAEKTERLVATHTLDASGKLIRGADEDMGWTGQGAFVQGPRRVFGGGGGLLSSAPDYARFLQMLLNGGELDGQRILSPASVRLMTTNHVGTLYAEAENEPGMGFGLGFEVKLEPQVRGYDVPMRASVDAYAWGGAAYTAFWVDPEQDLVAVFMAQMRPHRQDRLNRHFGNSVYQAIVAP